MKRILSLGIEGSANKIGVGIVEYVINMDGTEGTEGTESGNVKDHNHNQNHDQKVKDHNQNQKQD